MASHFSRYDLPEPGRFGFQLVAGPPHGLSSVMTAVGRLPADVGRPGHPMHLHHGEEIVRIISGQIRARVGDERRLCGPGDVMVMPAETLHGMVVLAETELQVIVRLEMGTAYPITTTDGERRVVDVYRRDSPWTQEPPDGAWTTDEELERILGAIDEEV